MFFTCRHKKELVIWSKDFSNTIKSIKKPRRIFGIYRPQLDAILRQEVKFGGMKSYNFLQVYSNFQESGADEPLT